MKKLVLFAAVVAMALGANGQPWMPSRPVGPVKLSDAVANYHHVMANYDASASKMASPEEEDDQYHFARWQWYWSQHLDQEGYMVPQRRTWDAWSSYLTRQGANKTTASTANWVFQGPDSCIGGYSGIGRVNCIALHPTNPAVIYAGAAGGGVWKTTDTGRTWHPIYSNLPTLGVSDIVINPLNPNTIFVCTGDADGYDTYGMGVIKSVDGGANWTVVHSALYYEWNRSIIMNPSDTNCLLLGTSTGMYRSRDAGTTWTITDSSDFKQVIYKPGDTSIVYASAYATWPATSAQIMRSTDGGSTWAQVTSLSGAGRIALAVTPAAPGIVKALVSESSTSGLQSILNSTNSGASFTAIYTNDTSCNSNLLGYSLLLPTSNCGGQGWYDLCIAIDPLNANKVIIGGVNNCASNDGGNTWAVVTTWWGGIPGIQTVHADKHCLVYSPLDHSLYQGCDGGIYRNPNLGTSLWKNITNGMGITQFYRNAVAPGVSFCLGGAQDNGTKMMDGGIYSDLTGGDGMQCRIDPLNPSSIWYTATQFGGLNRTINGGASYEDIRTTIPDTMDGAWITPYLIHHRDNNNLLCGLDILFNSYDMGNSWTAISPQFGASDKILHIAMSNQSDSFIYLLLSDNSIHFTPDYGGSWITLPASGTSYISRIEAEPWNKNILWVTYSGYGTQKVATYNLLTRTWTPMDGSLPDVPVNCIVLDTLSKTKYLGTDVAVFYRDSIMSDWALYNTNLPSVQVNDLNINYETGELWAATYGRGMWKSVKRELPNGISQIPYRADVVTLQPNPSKGVFVITTSNQALLAGTVQVKLMDAAGRTIWADRAAFDAGGTLKVDAKGVAPGVYICELTSEHMAARSRVVITQ